MKRHDKIAAVAATLVGVVGVGFALAQPPTGPMSFFLASRGSGAGGNLGGLAGADKICQDLAQAAGHGALTWRAYLSTQGQGAVNARDRIGPGPWFNVRGARIAQNVDELHSSANRLAVFTALDERGNQIPGSGFSPNRHDILTGSQPDGRAYPAGADMTCDNWTSSSDERRGRRQGARGPSRLLGVELDARLARLQSAGLGQHRRRRPVLLLRAAGAIRPAMRFRRRLVAGAAALVLVVGVSPLAGGKTRAECEREYTPQRGQDGKDVIWVPTEDSMVLRMLEMAKVTSADKVYDLGAGDGKIAIAAGKRYGAVAVGIEYDVDLARHAQCLVEAEGVEERVRIVQGDIFATDFSDATVVTLYLLPALNLRLRPILLGMPPGTRVVSYSFTMGEWEPDDYADTDDGSAYFWVVPARIAGAWEFRSDNGETLEVTFEQTFQMLRGSAGGAALAGKVDGARVEFAFSQGDGPVRAEGTMDGDRMSVTIVRGGGATSYIGTRP
jgi:hypothetical protein